MLLYSPSHRYKRTVPLIEHLREIFSSDGISRNEREISGFWTREEQTWKETGLDRKKNYAACNFTSHTRVTHLQQSVCKSFGGSFSPRGTCILAPTFPPTWGLAQSSHPWLKRQWYLLCIPSTHYFLKQDHRKKTSTMVNSRIKYQNIFQERKKFSFS